MSRFIPIPESKTYIMHPCPWCAGPPVIHISEMIIDEETYLDSHVWCHECGCKGPASEGFDCSAQAKEQTQIVAIELWNRRAFDGLNCYTREHSTVFFKDGDAITLYHFHKGLGYES